MKLRHLVLIACMNLFAPPAHGNVIWIDWSTGATQPFSNSSGNTGTISYTDSFQSVAAGSVTSPDSNFPFGNPVKILDIIQTPNASITFTFSGVSPDNNTIFTLGDLRKGNQFFVSAFDSSKTPISLTTWANLGQYPIYPHFDPNLWNPSTGLVEGTGPDNSKNLFLGLTSNTAKIRVDFVNNDQDFEALNFGIGQGASVPEPSSAAALVGIGGFAGILTLLRRRRKVSS